MENITILGAGDAGIALAKKIREKDLNCKITLIDKNTCYFCKKSLISNPSDISKRKNLDSLAQDLKADFINGKVERINPKRKKIYFKDNEPLSFENLVIASGLASKKLSIKGEHREGFFYLSGIDPFKLRDLLRVSNEATVYVSGKISLDLAIALNSLGKEVKIVCSNLDFLGEDKARVLSFLEQKGVCLYFDSRIEEVVGESMIKAVKISPLKVFSSQLVFIDSGFVPNLNFLEEEIALNGEFSTNFERVYLLGSVSGQDMGIEEQVNSFWEYLNSSDEVK